MTGKESIFAEKLEKLFEEVRKPGGSKHTQTEVIAATNGVLTRVYLWKLRTGRAVNPGFHIIKALADFFGVDTDYFSKEQTVAGEENIKPVGRYVAEIQARAVKLDEKARKAVLDLMDFILSIQPGESPGDRNRGTEPSGEENPSPT
jgi:transcriptional regulator with XRE-family HTH domain